ncbi:MAG: GGDEF domain-containing protein [Gammaproteobacteria bacterium]|nr:GGDEF domain-containing protein [Gammaproteobacteria bacterium]
MEALYFSPMLLGLNLLLALAVASTALWTMSRPIVGPGYWMAGLWLLISGVLLFAAFTVTRSVVLNIVGNALQMAGEAIFLLGIFRFLGHRMPYWIVPVSVLVLVAFNVHYWVNDGNSDFLMMVYAFIAGLLPIQAVWVLLRQRREPSTRLARLLVGVCLAIYSVVTLVRSAYSGHDWWSGAPYVQPTESFSYLLPYNFAMPALVMGFIGVTLMTMQRILAASHELETELKLLATIDPLTGALNRRSFNELFAQLQRSAEQHKTPLCMALLDLDDFKGVNDRQGHQAGDEALRLFSELCRREARKGDVFARFGGEEFVLLLPDTRLEDAQRLLERLLKAVAALEVRGPQGAFGFQASAGVSELRAGDTQDSFMQRADKALYRAKHLGRNRVSVES